MLGEDSISEALMVGGDDSRMLDRELRVIIDFINKYHKGGDTLEIGCYKGRVSYLFARANFESERADKGNHYAVDVSELL